MKKFPYLYLLLIGECGLNKNIVKDVKMGLEFICSDNKKCAFESVDGCWLRASSKLRRMLIYCSCDMSHGLPPFV